MRPAASHSNKKVQLPQKIKPPHWCFLASVPFFSLHSLTLESTRGRFWKPTSFSSYRMG